MVMNLHGSAESIAERYGFVDAHQALSSYQPPSTLGDLTTEQASAAADLYASSPMLQAYGEVAADTAIGALPPQAKDAYSKLAGDVQGHIQTAVKTYGKAAPAIAMALKIGSGGVPSESEVVGALAGVATMVGGPVVGAAFGAMGAAVIGFEAALKGLFQSLGLYDDAPKFNFVGFIRKGVDVIPYGPADSNWIHIDSPTDLNNFLFNGQGTHPALNKEQGFDGVMLEVFMQALLQADVTAACAFVNGSWQNSRWVPGPCNKQGLEKIFKVNPFDTYFAILLKKNLQNWANGQPYLLPRDALRNAVIAWNAIHQGTCDESGTCTADASKPMNVLSTSPYTVCYRPGERALSSNESIVNRVLGVDGDYPDYLANATPLCVNLGELKPLPGGATPTSDKAAAPSAATAPAGGVATAVKVAAVGVPLAAGAAWLALGQPTSLSAASVAAKVAWRSVTRFAGDLFR